ncbi:MAG: aquaporin [Elusimicrobia bacterium]|nr:aquaporin [Elusimicrobiota bacterium]
MAGNLKAILAEFIATFAFVLAGAGAVSVDALTGGGLGWGGIALAHALAATGLALVYGRASGAHFNPAVTLALLANGRLNLIKAVFYITAQLLGAALGSLFLKAVLNARPELASAPPFLGACDFTVVGYKAATLLEAVLTFFLVTAVYSTTVESRGSHVAAPLALGAIYGFGVLVSGPLTGGALNPARAFGPAVSTGHWAHWWVYWIGPLAGAAAASMLYEYLYLEKKQPQGL